MPITGQYLTIAGDRTRRKAAAEARRELRDAKRADPQYQAIAFQRSYAQEKQRHQALVDAAIKARDDIRAAITDAEARIILLDSRLPAAIDAIAVARDGVMDFEAEFERRKAVLEAIEAAAEAEADEAEFVEQPVIVKTERRS